MPPSIDSLELPPFKPRFPWWGADLQTIAVLLGTYQADLAPHTSERVCFCMADRSGDILVGMLDRPAAPQANRPLVILVHGITGCENSSHVLNGARHLLDLGYRVLRLNLRGCGASRPHCREHYHIGRTADFRRVLSQLPDDLTDNGIAVVGYSMGGAMLLKYLGEEGAFSPPARGGHDLRPARPQAHLRAHAAAAQLALSQLRPGRHQEGDAGRRRRALGGGAGDRALGAQRARIRRPFHRAALRLSRRRRLLRALHALDYMPEIRVPTMVLAAGDDPWIPVEYYRDFKWSDNPFLLSVTAEGGGHLGFHAADSDRPWCDTVLEKFLERV